MSKEGFQNILQITVGNNAKLYNLDSTPPQEICFKEDFYKFGSPEEYINTGYTVAYMDPINESRQMIIAN